MPITITKHPLKTKMTAPKQLTDNERQLISYVMATFSFLLCRGETTLMNFANLIGNHSEDKRAQEVASQMRSIATKYA